MSTEQIFELLDSNLEKKFNDFILKKSKKKKNGELTYYYLFKIQHNDLMRRQMIKISTHNTIFSEKEILVSTTVGSITMFSDKNLRKLIEDVGKIYEINITVKADSNIMLFCRMPMNADFMEKKTEIIKKLGFIADHFEMSVLKSDNF